ncbi:MAG: 4Fe-4S ferredoxin [Desulfuromonas sp.]|nr:MAG: 4Fe-4S ferredoxin [Desulfuromonas sp.]
MKKGWEERIRLFLTSLCADDPGNRLEPGRDEPAWGAPLIGIAAGEDPWFPWLKEHIGPFYWTPYEIFAQTFPNHPATPLSVVSWILPQTAATLAEQEEMRELQSERWAHSRFYGEAFNQQLRQKLCDFFAAVGVAAIAPELSPDFGRRESSQHGYASNWSERHAAFVAGLGTFGLSDGLITPLGKAIRCGSVVVALPLAATPRSYGDNPRAWCLHHAGRPCRACQERCPAGAISPRGHDKRGCHDYIRGVTTPYSIATYGVSITNCGLCQAKVPCATQIPPALRPKS